MFENIDNCMAERPEQTQQPELSDIASFTLKTFDFNAPDYLSEFLLLINAFEKKFEVSPSGSNRLYMIKVLSRKIRHDLRLGLVKKLISPMTWSMVIDLKMHFNHETLHAWVSFAKNKVGVVSCDESRILDSIEEILSREGLEIPDKCVKCLKAQYGPLKLREPTKNYHNGPKKTLINAIRELLTETEDFPDWETKVNHVLLLQHLSHKGFKDVPPKSVSSTIGKIRQIHRAIIKQPAAG